MGCETTPGGGRRRRNSIDVLYVDDDQSCGEAVTDALERESERLQATLVVKPQRVPSLLDEAEFDCLVSAFEMDAMDGLELLSTVRNTHPDIPFILFTGSGDERVASRAISNDVTDYVRKAAHDDPYRTLTDRVEAAVQEYRHEREIADPQLPSVLFDESPFGVIEWTSQFEIASVNPAVERLLGTTETELVGTSLVDFVSEGSRTDMRETLERLQAGEDVHSVYETVTAEGETVICEWHTSVVTEGDSVVTAFSQLQDITDLAESNRQMETLINNLPGIVYRSRNERGWPMEFVRGECNRLCGYSADQLESGDTMWGSDIIHPHDREFVWDTVQDAVADRESYELTYRIQSPDGDTRWVWERGRGVYAADGDVTALEGFITDITERKEREDAIEALHEATRTLVTAESKQEIADAVVDAAVSLLNLPHTGVHYYDPDRDELAPVAWTDTVEKMIGTPPVLDSDSLAWSAFKNGETCVYDNLHENGDPHNPKSPVTSELIVPLEEYGVVLVGSPEYQAFSDDDRRMVEILCANAAAALERMDREEQLRSREQDLERENDRLDRFVELISHDLRNPLNTAQLRLDLARQESDSEHLQKVATAHNRMETLISDLLTLAREGESVAGTKSVDLATLVKTCWRTVETGPASLNVMFDDAVVVEAEESRLAQVLENLFRNSVEHGSTAAQAPPDGEAQGGVTITVGPLEDGFYIEDNGPGIPEDERETVFDPGYSTAEQSTGFGLSIVQEIVQAHGWSVSVTDGADGGARFEIRGVELH